MGLTVTLLGQPGASLDIRGNVRLPTVRAEALLYFLITESVLGNGAQQRDELVELLWPGMPAGSGRKNLRQTLYYLRQAIDVENGAAEVTPIVLADRRTIGINPAFPLTADVARFLQYAGGDEADQIEAIALYRGDLLTGFAPEISAEFDSWLLARSALLRNRALDLLEGLAAAALRRQAFVDARLFAERQIELDSLREIAHQQLMEALARSGYREQAVHQYLVYRRLLAEEMGLAPSEQTEMLYRRIRSDELGMAAPLSRDVRGYHLLEQIGEGSFGTIHRAVQLGVDREVAIKVIKGKFADDARFVRRFELEAQTVARLEHPYIVPLYDFWRDPSGAYLVMRYMRGGDLSGRLKKGALEPDHCLAMTEQIAAALAAAHDRGVIHRDIKPENILFDESGTAYLSDFGIAGHINAGDREREDLLALGTPVYTSPEQLRSEPASSRSDVYSLGMVLFEALTGEKPFAGQSIADIVRGHLSGQLPPVTAKVASLPAQVNEVVFRATEGRPERRFAGPAELASALSLALRGVSAPVSVAHSADVSNPYKGLRAFQEMDAGDFFGREALVDQLVARMADARFLAVVGPSGSGKSSVVKAGLLPALRAGRIPGSENWIVAEMVPGVYPLDELERALWPVAVHPPPSLIEELNRDERGILHAVQRVLPAGTGSRLLLVIDQFEELFTLVDDAQRRERFITGLLTALEDPDELLRVVITLRADFYDRPLRSPELGAKLKTSTEIVLPMTPAELISAIEEPARARGIVLDEGLAAAMLVDLKDQPGALPLMQFALTELFERREGLRLTLSAYQEIGGVSGALGRRAESLYAGLNQRRQEAARQLFVRLVSVGDEAGRRDTRRRTPRAELTSIIGRQIGVEGADISAVIDLFGRFRLLSFDRDPITRAPTVEVAHEALLSEWSRLHEWLAASRSDIRLQHMLAVAANEWQAAGKAVGFLLRGAQLSQYEEWSERSGLALTRSEQEFLQACLKAREERRTAEEARQQRELETAKRLAETEAARAEEQAQAARALRRRAAFLTAALVLAVLLAVFAIVAGLQAQNNFALAEAESQARATQQAVAEESAALAQQESAARATEQARAERSAAESQSLALASAARLALDDGNSDQALALAMAANQLTDPPAFSQQALYEIALSPGTSRRIAAGGDWLWVLLLDPIGQIVGSSAEPGVLTFWDLRSGDQRHRIAGALSAEIGGVGITPDGSRVLISDFVDDSLLLWDLASDREVWRQINPGGDPNYLAVSPDGSSVVVASELGVATVWDLQSGRQVGELVGHDAEVQLLGAAFSPDGSLIATSSEDGTAIIWDASTLELMTRLEGHGHIVFSVTFSPDGNTVATASFDQSVRLWSAATGEELDRLEGHTGFVFDVEFSPDGERLLTASADQTLRLWDSATGELIRTLSGAEGRVLNVEFIDDHQAVSGDATSSLRFWTLDDGREAAALPLPAAPVSGAAVAAGIGLVAAGSNQEIQLIDTAGERLTERLQFRDSALQTVPDADIVGNVLALAVDPAGNLLLSGSDDGSLRLWDPATRDAVRRYEGHSLRINSLAFTPDGQRFWSASDDRSLKLWEVAGEEVVLDVQNPTDAFNSVAVSPAGDLTAAGVGSLRFPELAELTTRENAVYIFDAATGEVRRRITGHDGPVVSVAFSPDGRYLLSGSIDNTVRLWDVADGREIRRFDGHSGGVFTLAFSPDGAYAASGSLDGSAIVWQVNTGELLRRYGDLGGSVVAVSFSADGRQLHTISENGGWRLWNLLLDLPELLRWTTDNRYIRDLTCAERMLYFAIAECAE